MPQSCEGCSAAEHWACFQRLLQSQHCHYGCIITIQAACLAAQYESGIKKKIRGKANLGRASADCEISGGVLRRAFNDDASLSLQQNPTAKKSRNSIMSVVGAINLFGQVQDRFSPKHFMLSLVRRWGGKIPQLMSSAPASKTPPRRKRLLLLPLLPPFATRVPHKAQYGVCTIILSPARLCLLFQDGLCSTGGNNILDSWA